MGEDDALELVGKVDQIYVSKGKKLVHLNLKKERPDRKTITGLLLGPTGNLRAPTLRRGKTLVVGFDQATYEDVLC